MHSFFLAFRDEFPMLALSGGMKENQKKCDFLLASRVANAFSMLSRRSSKVTAHLC